jgi:hypothetical protein
MWYANKTSEALELTNFTQNPDEISKPVQSKGFR